MSKTYIKVINERNILEAIAHKIKNKKEIATSKLKEVAAIIKEESQNEVPVDTGLLHDSFEILEENNSKTRVSIRFGYGLTKDPENLQHGRGEISKYMMVVHEDLFRYHENGKAKFFEDPVNRHRSEIVPLVKEATGAK